MNHIQYFEIIVLTDICTYLNIGNVLTNNGLNPIKFMKFVNFGL